MADSNDRSSPEPLRFVHRDLNLSRQQIRLLKISEGRNGSSDPIRCEIRHFNSEDWPSYRAVSYTWGEPHPTREIILSESPTGLGLPFSVRENLWLFLDVVRDKRLQHEELSVNHRQWYHCEWYWIDAICIHQANVGERNHQVQLMKTIYSSAEDVLSWLGPAANESDLVVANIRSWFLADSLFLKQDDHKFVDNGSTRKAINAFFNRDYWKRVWIVQEYRLARKNLVMCGQSAIPGYYLHRFFRHYDSSCMKHAWAVLRDSHIQKELLLSIALERYLQSHCSDVRDRVFGIMALVVGYAAVPVDYSKSAQE